MSPLTYRPESLGAELQAALQATDEWCDVRIADALVGPSLAAEDLPDVIVTPQTEMEIRLPRSDPVDMSARSFVEMCNEFVSREFAFDGLVYHLPIRTIVAVDPADAKAHYMVANLQDGSSRSLLVNDTHNGRGVRVGVSVGSIHYALAIVKEDYFWDKYYPPYDNESTFVEVEHSAGLERDDALDVVHAYLFELGSTMGLSFSFSPRAEEADAFDSDAQGEEGEIEKQAGSQRLRSLLLGDGMGPLLREYQAAVSASNQDSSVLGFAKCIEYTAASVIRQRQYEDIRRRLMSPEAINPGAPFIDGLVALVDEHRAFTKDSESLKLTVDKCCDAHLLSSVSPPSIRSLAALPAAAKASERKAALSEFSLCLSSTRNRIAHAKANYEASGHECPESEMDQLIQCAKLAAEQCIRWYGDLSPSLRRR